MRRRRCMRPLFQKKLLNRFNSWRVSELEHNYNHALLGFSLFLGLLQCFIFWSITDYFEAYFLTPLCISCFVQFILKMWS